jgi:very-short-patch-repair endonuclease
VPKTLDPKVERLLGEFFREQERVVSREQANSIGVSDGVISARLLAGVWQRGYPGTYIAHTGEPSYLTRVWSALLYAGSGALASHETAGYIDGIVPNPPRFVHVTVPTTRRVRRQSGLVIHLAFHAAAKAAVGARPPRTTKVDPVLDIASVARRPDDVVGILTTACQRGATTPDSLSVALARRRRMRNRALVSVVIEAIADGAHSVLEWRYMRDVERAHGLPKGKRQAPRRRKGGREWLDVCYEDFGLIVELDGERFHEGVQRRVDRARDNAATRRGEHTLRFGWVEVFSAPCETAAEVGEMLAALGWSGSLRKCPRCR